MSTIYEVWVSWCKFWQDEMCFTVDCAEGTKHWIQYFIDDNGIIVWHIDCGRAIFHCQLWHDNKMCCMTHRHEHIYRAYNVWWIHYAHAHTNISRHYSNSVHAALWRFVSGDLLKKESSQRHDMAVKTWWRHQVGTFSTLPTFCAGNSPVTGEFPAQKPVTRIFDVFFDLCLE